MQTKILGIVLCAMVFALQAQEQQAGADVPELLQPVTLRDADGNAETGLVDPFRRRGEDSAEGAAEPGEDGLLRTSMGEISSEFRILAITIPEDENIRRSALIQFYNSDEPVLVHEDDLVRVDRNADRTSKGRGRGAVRATARRGAASRNDALEQELEKYVFYLRVKNIEETYIEVYHNKKRPDETIRLNW